MSILGLRAERQLCSASASSTPSEAGVTEVTAMNSRFAHDAGLALPDPFRLLWTDAALLLAAVARSTYRHPGLALARLLAVAAVAARRQRGGDTVSRQRRIRPRQRRVHPRARRWPIRRFAATTATPRASPTTMIQEDSALLAKGASRCCACSTARDKVARLIAASSATYELDFKVMLGAYIFSEETNTLTDAQAGGQQGIQPGRSRPRGRAGQRLQGHRAGRQRRQRDAGVLVRRQRSTPASSPATSRTCATPSSSR